MSAPVVPFPNAMIASSAIFTVIMGIAAVASAQSATTIQSAAVATLGTPSLVFDHVTVVDVEQGRLLQDQRVVIAANRIHAVESAGKVEIPAGARVVDARGKYLIPGLWDLHTHSQSLANLFYPLFVANGITGIRDAWSEIPLDTLVQWQREILAGTRVGPPRQLIAGGSFGQHYPNDGDPTAIQSIVDSLKAHGANFLKVYPFSFAVAAAARQAGLPFGGHLNGFNPFQPIALVDPIDASDSGMRIFDHIAESELLGLCFGHGLKPSDDATVERCRPIADRFRHNESWWVPTFIRTAHRGYRGAVQSYLAARAGEFWAGALLPGNWLRDPAHPMPTAVDFPPDSVGFLRVAEKAGLPILAGTDVGAPVIRKIPPGFSLQTELAMYVAEGLTPLEALQTATLNPAKLLHATDSLGTVAVGRLADLVLLDADPLADITNTTTVRAVVANGRYYDRSALDRLLVEAQQAIRSADLPQETEP